MVSPADTSTPPVTKAVLFDADGVIQYPRTGWLVEMARLGGLGFVQEIFALEKTTLTGEVDLRELMEESLRRRERSCSPEDILRIWHDIKPDELMLDLVRRVRQAGATTVLATNQQSYRGSHMKRTMDYDDYFDAAFYSFDIGLRKPDPAFFHHILDHLGLAPEEVVFVDDMPENVTGARSVGIRAEVFGWADTYGHLRYRLREQGVPGL